MNEDCKECIYVDQIKERLKEGNEKFRRIEERLIKLETTSATESEKINHLSQLMDDIKKDIKTIIETLKEAKKANKDWIYSVGGSIVSGIIIALILKFIK